MCFWIFNKGKGSYSSEMCTYTPCSIMLLNAQREVHCSTLSPLRITPGNQSMTKDQMGNIFANQITVSILTGKLTA